MNSHAVCLLLSGGIDSYVVGRMLLDEGLQVASLFVDYGQAAASAERNASSAVADELGIAWAEARLVGSDVLSSGEIPGRNDFLISTARLLCPGNAIAIGVHAGTGYADCSTPYCSIWQQNFELQDNGETQLLTPLVDFTKQQVYDLFQDLSLYVGLTYSCEVGGTPCGSCNSCLDRKLLNVSA